MEGTKPALDCWTSTDDGTTGKGNAKLRAGSYPVDVAGACDTDCAIGVDGSYTEVVLPTASKDTVKNA
jgi:hypothetical protein